MIKDCLYVVVPYFNFANYSAGKVQLERFISHMGNQPLVRLVLVEGKYKGLSLPDYSQKVYKHIKVDLPDVLWVKENLINIGLSQLPPDWKYAGWFDRDLLFTNTLWAEETIQQLEVNDLVQPWTECVFLNDNHEHSVGVNEFAKNEIFTKSFCGVFLNEIIDKATWYLNRFIHPGQAWTINRNFYNQIGQLYDKAIVGGADSLPLIAKLQLSRHPTLTCIGEDVSEYLNKLKEARLGVTRGLICHYKHGSEINRKYIDRHAILQQAGYNPKTFLTYNKDGVLVYTDTGKIIEKAVLEYFLSRQEDGV